MPTLLLLPRWVEAQQAVEAQQLQLDWIGAQAPTACEVGSSPTRVQASFLHKVVFGFSSSKVSCAAPCPAPCLCALCPMPDRPCMRLLFVLI